MLILINLSSSGIFQQTFFILAIFEKLLDIYQTRKRLTFLGKLISNEQNIN